MKVFILGAGGHGMDLAEITRACGHPTTLHDDDRSKHLRPIPSDRPYLLGIADPQARAARDRPANTPGVFVHPSVVGQPRFDKLTCGVVVGAGTTIGPNVTLGRHTHIGAGCTLTRTTIGDYCQIAPGVDIAGDVTIGDRVFVGVGATIKNLITIGDDAVIGAGAVVIYDVPAGATVAGVPARPTKPRPALHDYTGYAGTDRCLRCNRPSADLIHDWPAA